MGKYESILIKGVNMSGNRSNFSGKIGFVFAAAASAVGLGNIWRFPYLAAKYGGGIFLLVYLVLTVTFGFALMTAEIAIGRKTGTSAINAFTKLDKRFGFIGWIGSLVPMIILPYYSVIGGWVVKYFGIFVSGSGTEAAKDGYFDAFISQTWQPIFCFFIFIALTTLVVMLGVEKGIEKVSKIMMPLLIALTLFIAVYSLFMPGAIDGVAYYLKPDFSHFSVTTVLAAMGQLFYSMSISMGIMITYGSYMKKSVNLESSVRYIEIFDTGIAFLAGLMIIPAVFSFSGGDQTVLGKGPGLMFVTLPKVFSSMPGGDIIGAVFFVLVFFAAVTSSISLMETVVSIVCDKLGWKRKTTCLVVLIGSFAVGLLSTMGFGVLDHVRIFGMSILDMFDFISNSVIMPIVALLTCIFVGYFLKPKALIDEVEIEGEFKKKTLFVVIIKYFAPICIVLILISSILDALGIMVI